MDFTLHDLAMLKVKVTIIYTKYLENGDRYEVGPREDFSESSHELSIGTVRFNIG